MILDDFVHFNATGLYCPYGDFYIDPQQPVKTAVVSHAHGDHAVSGNNEVYCTESTRQFMHIRYGKNAGRVFNIADYHQKFRVGKVDVIFIPAGHILGSAQILMEYEGTSYLYTGDFKLQEDATCEPYEITKADVLITESTFARPENLHPDPVSEIKKLNDIKINILLGAYGLGKSQRIIQLINQHAPQKKVLVHHRIMPLCKVYEDAGFKLGKYEMYNRKAMKVQDEFVYIVPPFTFDSYYHAVGVKRLFASGWQHLQVNSQDTLIISDHADWNDILFVIDKMQPQQVWTLHGEGKYLSAHFRNSIFVKTLG